ncbi:MAG TPA: stage III sporulation protein AE [Firmicutes bacterium]|nr:stage III sporulation protein AE [Bacillota bacterium]
MRIKLEIKRILLVLIIVLSSSFQLFITEASALPVLSEKPPAGNSTGQNRELPTGWQQIEAYWNDVKKEMDDFLPSWGIEDIWKGKGDRLLPNPGEVASGLFRYFFSEVLANMHLLGQLILLALAASLLKNLQGAFGNQEIAALTETIIFFVLLGVAMGSFTLAAEIGRSTVEKMADFMLALVPVLLTLMASLGHITSVSLFHPLIIFAVNLMASLIRNAIFPLIFFATILYLIDHFSPHFKINRLADLFKDICLWALGLMLTLFIGFTAIQGVAGSIGDALTLRTAKFMTGTFVPVVGKMLADSIETVLGYSLLLKNSATIAGLIILLLMIVFPLLKLLALVLIFKLSGALVQPLGETMLGGALQTMSNCLVLVFSAVATVALAFFIGTAIVVGASNATVMLR